MPISPIVYIHTCVVLNVWVQLIVNPSHPRPSSIANSSFIYTHTYMSHMCGLGSLSTHHLPRLTEFHDMAFYQQVVTAEIEHQDSSSSSSSLEARPISICYTSMAKCKAVVTPLPKQWSYCSLALNHCHDIILLVWELMSTWRVWYGLYPVINNFWLTCHQLMDHYSTLYASWTHNQ